MAAVLFAAAIALEGSDGLPPGDSGVLSETGLLEAVAGADQAVYWIGPQPGVKGYELIPAEDGSITLNYVAKGGGEGGSKAAFVVAGYPVPDAQGALRNAQSTGEGLTISEYPSWDVLSGEGNNAYVAYDGVPDLQIEIYSPKSGEAERLAKAGALTPLE